MRSSDRATWFTFLASLVVAVAVMNPLSRSMQGDLLDSVLFLEYIDDPGSPPADEFAGAIIEAESPTEQTEAESDDGEVTADPCAVPIDYLQSIISGADEGGEGGGGEGGEPCPPPPPPPPRPRWLGTLVHPTRAPYGDIFRPLCRLTTTTVPVRFYGAFRCWGITPADVMDCHVASREWCPVGSQFDHTATVGSGPAVGGNCCFRYMGTPPPGPGLLPGQVLERDIRDWLSSPSIGSPPPPTAVMPWER